MGRLRLWFIGFLAMGAAIACDGPLSSLPPDASALPPHGLPQYLMWWQVTESCSGISGQFSTINWYYVPGASRINDPQFRDAAAAWYPDRNAIVIAGRWLDSGSVVRHEMLHALSRHGHTAALFHGTCAGIVDCEESCLTDIGAQAAVPDSATLVQASDLEVSVDYFPKPYADPGKLGYLVAIVSAKNTRTVPVRVALSRGPGSVYATTFQYQLRFPTSGGFSAPPLNGAASTTESTVGFMPGETRRFAFDVSQFYVGVTKPTATGLFNGAASAPVNIILP